MWDEKTIELFEKNEISKTDRATLLAVFDIKKSESGYRKEADALKESAKILGLHVMWRVGGKIKVEDVGSLSVTTGSTTTYDGEAIAKSLLEQGVDIKVAKKAIKAGETVTTWKPGLKFLAARVK